MDTNLSCVKRIATKGQGIVASSDLAPGDVIIRIKEPYMIIPESTVLDQVCSQCLYQKESLSKCTGCKAVKYCSKRCQTSAWKSGHKAECAILQKLQRVPPTPTRGVMTLLLQRKIGSSEAPAWSGLMNHYQSLKDNGRWDSEILPQATAAVMFTGSPKSSLNTAGLALCTMATNAFRVTLADGSEIGLCFEPIVSLANHSCTPNATITFDGRRLELRALNHIQKNEEIYISYIDPTKTRDVRRKELKERYFFDCECDKCSNDDDSYTTCKKWHATQAATIAAFPKVDQFINNPGYPDILAAKRYAEAPYPNTIHATYLSYLDQNNYAASLTVLLFLYLNCDIYLYPQPHHPTCVIRLYTIARLLKLLASMSDGERAAEKLQPLARELLESIDLISALQVMLILVHDLGALSHGPSSAFMQEIASDLTEVEEIQKQRGTAGAALKHWGKRPKEEGEGKVYATKIFEGLRALAALGENWGGLVRG